MMWHSYYGQIYPDERNCSYLSTVSIAVARFLKTELQQFVWEFTTLEIDQCHPWGGPTVGAVYSDGTIELTIWKGWRRTAIHELIHSYKPVWCEQAVVEATAKFLTGQKLKG